MIKVVIFDYDGVLVQEPSSYLEILVSKFDLTESERSFLKEKYKEGIINNISLWDSVETVLREKGISKKEIEETFNEWMEHENQLFEEIGPILNSLKKKQIPVFVASNTFKEKAVEIRKGPISDKISGVFSSHELNLLKPDLKFYEKIYQIICLRGEQINKFEILFIDNRKENIEAANKFGFKAFISNNVSNTVAILRANDIL